MSRHKHPVELSVDPCRVAFDLSSDLGSLDPPPPPTPATKGGARQKQQKKRVSYYTSTGLQLFNHEQAKHTTVLLLCDGLKIAFLEKLELIEGYF